MFYKISTTIIGCENKTGILENLLPSCEAELLTLYGRRRIGKTKEQLINFVERLSIYFQQLRGLLTK